MKNSIELLSRSDNRLAEIISKVEMDKHISTANVFHDLIGCIIEQQIHYRSTKNTYFKLLEKAGVTELMPSSFEQFEALSLSGTKLSVNKLATLQQVIELWPKMPQKWEDLTDDEVRNALGKIKGVGLWTQEMVLMYTLNRSRIFPADDFHLKQIMTAAYKLNPKVKLKAQMKAVAAKWSPNESLAVKYLFAWKNHLKNAG